MEDKVKKILLSAAFLCAALPAVSAERVGDWWVNVSPDAYKQMSSSERTCVDRAVGQFNAGAFKAAAEEWKRFQTEFITTATEDVAAWAAFFYAFSLDKAKERYKAIEMYTENLDLYPETTAWTLSLFFRGRANILNGNNARGYEDYSELIGNPDCKKHPVAYAAYDALAWHALSGGRINEAIRLWTELCELPSRGNPVYWRNASSALSLLKALADPSGEISRIASMDTLDFEKRREKLREWRSFVWRAVRGNSSVAKAYFKANKKGAKNEEAAAVEYLKKMSVAFSSSATPIYSKCPGGRWELVVLDYEVVSTLMPKNAEKALAMVVKALNAEKNPKTRTDRADSFVSLLVSQRRWEDSKFILSCYADPVRRAWRAVDIGWRIRDGKYILENLDLLERNPDPEVVRKAKLNRARCCKEITRDYDTAVKIWNEYPDPPWTLWQCAECHYAAGRKNIAQGILDEICGVFPKDAAAAMLRKGDWYAADGNKKNAISCYRRILQHADWKKSGSASLAHQRLERYGIATGGAVLNEVH